MGSIVAANMQRRSPMLASTHKTEADNQHSRRHVFASCSGTSSWYHCHMNIVDFPKKRRRTAEEHQHGYMKRWWAHAGRVATFSILVAVIVVYPLALFGLPWFGIDVPSAGQRLFCAIVSAIVCFVVLVEPRPPRDAGEVTRRVLEDSEKNNGCHFGS